MTQESTGGGIPAVAPFLLEESYVLGIHAGPGEVRVTIDFVLTPEHPSYSEPKTGELFCYRRGNLTFHGVERLVWSGQGSPPARDASDEADYGNIDVFALQTVGYILEGSFGPMEIKCDSVEVGLDA